MSSVTISVDTPGRAMIASGRLVAGESVDVSVVGAAPARLYLVDSRRSIVAYCDAFVPGESSGTGELNLATDAIAAIVSGIPAGRAFPLQILVEDAAGAIAGYGLVSVVSAPMPDALIHVDIDPYVRVSALADYLTRAEADERYAPISSATPVAPSIDPDAAGKPADAYQAGLQLAAKQDVIADLADIRSGAALGATAVQPAALAAVATTGNYADLENKPTVPAASDATPQADGAGAAGIATAYARGDHQHPTSIEAANIGPGGNLSVYARVRVSASVIGTDEIPTALGMNQAIAGNLAAAFSTSSTYALGDYCTHGGQLYKCTTAVATAGAWNAANWTAVAVTDEMGGGGITGVKLNGAALTPDSSGVVSMDVVPWANAARNAVTVGTRAGTIGTASIVVGTSCTASGFDSVATGNETEASARAHAEGGHTKATAWCSHAEGSWTTASGNPSHAEGGNTTASGTRSHAEGYYTTASGASSHAEGAYTYATSSTGPSHAEGTGTTAAGANSHADGYRAVTAASGNGASASTPHDRAFAWQGDNSGSYYHSHGAGTFNINPAGGAAGFYIGESTFPQAVAAIVEASPSLRYAAGATITASAQLADRTGNRVVPAASNSADIVLTFPAAVAGYLRDFLVLVTNTAGNTGDIIFTPPTGATVYGAGLTNTPASGETWLYSISEVAANVFWIKSEKMEVAQ